MHPESPDQRLSRISTLWSLVCQAQHARGETANSARQQLLERYGLAVRRYLHRLLPDPEAVDEVFQEFALQLIHGDLRGADPKRGRFRNFVKGTLLHLVADYRKERREWPGPLPDGGAALAANPENLQSDGWFEESWCDELLARAWRGLAEIEARTCEPYYAVLRYRADHPEFRSPQMAEHFTGHLGRPFTPAGVRQILHRARMKFAYLLLDEVTHSLENPTPERLEQELFELGLLEYCRPALERSDLEA
jgi:DNA-directed RNA polymerase specialized sigma24 family protein